MQSLTRNVSLCFQTQIYCIQWAQQLIDQNNKHLGNSHHSLFLSIPLLNGTFRVLQDHFRLELDSPARGISNVTTLTKTVLPGK